MSQLATEVEYLSADPRLRRAVLVALAVAVLAGALAIGWLLPWLETTLLLLRAEGRLTVPWGCYLFLALVGVAGLPVVWLGWHMARYGSRTLATGRYPPPGARVLRRTPVLRGRAAHITGRGQQVLGALLACCGLALVALAVWGALAIAR